MHTTTSKNNKNQTASGRSSQQQQLQGKTPMAMAAAGARALRHFVTPTELEVLGNCCRGEEAEFYMGKLAELGALVDNMPTTYETDGQGDNAVVWLHYFSRDCDWYITERDQEEEQLQAFGLTCMWEEELGYISIAELIECGAELDLYWTPKTVGEVKAERLMSNTNYTGHPMHY